MRATQSPRQKLPSTLGIHISVPRISAPCNLQSSGGNNLQSNYDAVLHIILLVTAAFFIAHQNVQDLPRLEIGIHMKLKGTANICISSKDINFTKY